VPEKLPEPPPQRDLDAEFRELFADEGIVVMSHMHGRMVAAFCRPLLIEKGWTRSMALRALELYVDSGFLSAEVEEE
jgi:hypothetical protein